MGIESIPAGQGTRPFSWVVGQVSDLPVHGVSDSVQGQISNQLE